MSRTHSAFRALIVVQFAIFHLLSSWKTSLKFTAVPTNTLVLPKKPPSPNHGIHFPLILGCFLFLSGTTTFIDTFVSLPEGLFCSFHRSTDEFNSLESPNGIVHYSPSSRSNQTQREHVVSGTFWSFFFRLTILEIVIFFLASHCTCLHLQSPCTQPPRNLCKCEHWKGCWATKRLAHYCMRNPLTQLIPHDEPFISKLVQGAHSP